MTCWIRNVYARDYVPLDDPTNLGGWGWNLLRWINDEIDARQPWKITIAEDMWSWTFRMSSSVRADLLQKVGRWRQSFNITGKITGKPSLSAALHQSYCYWQRKRA